MLDSYLQKLSFDTKLNRSLMARLLGAPRLLFLAIVSIVIAGIFAYSTLPRELTPEIEIPIVIVTTVLPGANPLDIESLITDKLEKEINALPDIDSITSSSREGVSTIVVTFVSSADPDKKLTEVKEKVDLVTDLPEDATVPRVAKLNFNDQPVLRVALVGDTDIRSLTQIALAVQDKLEVLPSVRSVSLAGEQKEQVMIDLDEMVLQTYGVNQNQISQAIRANTVTFPIGSLSVNQTEYQISVDSSVATVDQIRMIPIAVGVPQGLQQAAQGQSAAGTFGQQQTQTVLLGDIARVYLRAVTTNTVTTYASERTNFNAIQAIEISVFKTSTATITDTAQKAASVLNEIVEQYPQARLVPIFDNGVEIADQFDDLTINFRDTIFLVFITLFIFIGLKQALVASISIPLTFLSAFVIMQIVGLSLNFLTLFSLLLALGLVVDDAIVIVEASYRYGKKFPPLQAGLLVFRDFVVPIWTTTLTTVWAFLPLLLATGIIGEFIKSIPIVVSATLLSSTAIAVFINLPLVVVLGTTKIPKRVVLLLAGLGVLLSTWIVYSIVQGSEFAALTVFAWVLVLLMLFWVRRELTAIVLPKLRARLPAIPKSISYDRIINIGIVDLSVVTEKYRNVLMVIIKRPLYRYMVYGMSVGFFVLSIVFLVTGLLKNEFFPQTDQDQLYVNVRGPAGWPLEKTQSVLTHVQTVLLEQPEVKHVVSQTNTTFAGSFGSGEAGPHLAYVSVVLHKASDRERTSMQLATDLRAYFDSFVEADVSVVEQSGGPPVGADLEVALIGRDMAVLEQVSQDFMNFIAEIPGAVNIDSTLKQNAGQIQIQFNPVALQQRGLTIAQVSGTLRSVVTGSQVSEVAIAQEDLNIVVQYPQDTLSLSMLQNIVLQGPAGNYSLADVATLSLVTSPTTIDHQDLERVVRVGASAQGVSAPDLLRGFEEKVATYDLPSGVRWTVGGVNQENQESTLSIIRAMGLSVILILVTMVLQLQSFRKSFLVLLVIPLAVAGVFFNFTVFGVPLSFAALIGVLALFGIVVNNSIMLVEKINQNMRFNLPFVDAITSACSSRLEAIFFTSLTTSMGLLPITIADPFWRGLGGAIIAGLSVSGILILFLLPTLYYEFYKSSSENGVVSD